MADVEVVKGHEFTRRAGGKKHPWDQWLDGQCRRIRQEAVGDVQLKYLVSQARTQASKRNKGLASEIHEDEGYVLLQAVPMSDEVKARRAAKANGQSSDKKGGKKGKKGATADSEA